VLGVCRPGQRALRDADQPDDPRRRGRPGLPVAEVSAHFLPPWAGKFAPDCFHPSQAGYRDWSRALLAAIKVAETSSTLRSA